jgi:hypothetical protein
LQLTQLLKATSWLRVGEQENCIVNHTSDSCPLEKMVSRSCMRMRYV